MELSFAFNAFRNCLEDSSHRGEDVKNYLVAWAFDSLYEVRKQLGEILVKFKLEI
jgi:hypothetical protein